eukprot:6179568-Pleurochrysis_carterae.AAC.5
MILQPRTFYKTKADGRKKTRCVLQGIVCNRVANLSAPFHPPSNTPRCALSLPSLLSMTLTCRAEMSPRPTLELTGHPTRRSTPQSQRTTRGGTRTAARWLQRLYDNMYGQAAAGRKWYKMTSKTFIAFGLTPESNTTRAFFT